IATRPVSENNSLMVGTMSGLYFRAAAPVKLDPGGFAPADPPAPALAGPHDPRSAPAGAPVARLFLDPGGFAPAAPRRLRSRGPTIPAPLRRARRWRASPFRSGAPIDARKTIGDSDCAPPGRIMGSHGRGSYGPARRAVSHLGCQSGRGIHPRGALRRTADVR